MRSALSRGEEALRLRVIAVFAAHRRWLGFYTIRFHGRIRGRRSLAMYCAVLAWMVERGELLMSYDADHGFWRYLYLGRMSRPIGASDVREVRR